MIKIKSDYGDCEISEENLAYIREWLLGAENIEIVFNWNFDEQQADPFHNNFSKQEFINTLKALTGLKKMDWIAKLK